ANLDNNRANAFLTHGLAGQAKLSSNATVQAMPKQYSSAQMSMKSKYETVWSSTDSIQMYALLQGTALGNGIKAIVTNYVHEAG
ncbi:MAG: hypothetical protein AAF585_12850, partial [Verrucomicrobiota bacterium]